MIEEELRRGVDAGAFDAPNVPGIALAVLSLGIDVARWYRPNRPETPEGVGEFYAEIVLRMVTP